MIEKLDHIKHTDNLYDKNGFITNVACGGVIISKINELVDAVNNIVSVQEKLIDSRFVVETKHEEPEIPNTAYVTLTEEGCFVGGEPTTQYNGEDIYRPYLCVAYFKEARDIIREEYGYELLELHCLQSSTEGKWAETGNPVPDKDGSYSWVGVVYKNKEDKVASSSWVFYNVIVSASNCAFSCASNCAHNVQSNRDFRGALFGSLGA